MSVRHVAAISIAGWFLMTAPMTSQGVDQTAPLNEWKKAHHFDSEPDCDAERRDSINAAQDEAELAPNSDVDQGNKQDTSAAMDAAVSAQCIADNDPRITGKGVEDAVGSGLFRKLAPGLVPH